MVAIIIAAAFLGLGTALFYWIKVSSIPLTHGIENKEEAERLSKECDFILAGVGD